MHGYWALKNVHRFLAVARAFTCCRDSGVESSRSQRLCKTCITARHSRILWREKWSCWLNLHHLVSAHENKRSSFLRLKRCARSGIYISLCRVHRFRGRHVFHFTTWLPYANHWETIPIEISQRQADSQTPAQWWATFGYAVHLIKALVSVKKLLSVLCQQQ